MNCGVIPDCSQGEEEDLPKSICKQLRDKGALCCDILPSCDDNCQEMLAPNPNAAKLFEGLYAGLADPAVPLTPANKIAISRFLSNCEGEKLLNELSNLTCPDYWNAPPGCKMGSYLKFKLRFRDLVPDSPEAGSVAPGQSYPNPDPEVTDPELLQKFIYTVSVTNQEDTPPGTGNGFPTPGGGGCSFAYAFSDGSSEMAATIHHELMHIWWMNQHQTDYYNSGHGPDAENCNAYNPEFLRRLRDFYRVMDGLEKCLKANE